MNERWVCKRCFADNQETDAACTRCGLLRGADATHADQGAWATAASTPEKRPGWQGLLRFWWIPLTVVVLAVGYLTSARRADDGSLTSAGNVDVTELRIGDCFSAGDEVEIADVDGVPCDEPHQYEVFAVADHEGDVYPTEAEMDAIFESTCVAAFEPYVGADYATSSLYASMITPSESSWDDGDREYVCTLYEPVDETLVEVVELTGSMRDSRR